VAYREARVGFDIGSGNKAARVDMFGPELRSLDKQSVEMRHFESRGWPLSKERGHNHRSLIMIAAE
jgi:hypothetical protein